MWFERSGGLSLAKSVWQHVHLLNHHIDPTLLLTYDRSPVHVWQGALIQFRIWFEYTRQVRKTGCDGVSNRDVDTVPSEHEFATVLTPMPYANPSSDPIPTSVPPLRPAAKGACSSLPVFSTHSLTFNLMSEQGWKRVPK